MLHTVVLPGANALLGRTIRPSSAAGISFRITSAASASAPGVSGKSSCRPYTCSSGQCTECRSRSLLSSIHWQLPLAAGRKAEEPASSSDGSKACSFDFLDRSFGVIDAYSRQLSDTIVPGPAVRR